MSEVREQGACPLLLGFKCYTTSDGHTLAEIGDFAYHVDLLKEAGYNGDLKDILI